MRYFRSHDLVVAEGLENSKGEQNEANSMYTSIKHGKMTLAPKRIVVHVHDTNIVVHLSQRHTALTLADRQDTTGLAEHPTHPTNIAV
jgi:hypothetical protein